MNEAKENLLLSAMFRRKVESLLDLRLLRGSALTLLELDEIQRNLNCSNSHLQVAIESLSDETINHRQTSSSPL